MSSPTITSGTHDILVGRLGDLAADSARRGDELGVQICVCSADGEVLVNVAAGDADESGQPITLDTKFLVFSATKGVTATALHLQVAKGRLEYGQRIADVWPEFSCHGKGGATVADALTHRVGIPQMPDHTTVELMCDWEYMTDAVARLEPLWEPGSRTGYHSYTFGWIVGELVCRSDPDKRTFTDFVRDEVSDPLEMGGFFLGDIVPGTQLATLVDRRPSAERTGLRARVIPPELDTVHEVFGRDDVLASCHPAAGGVSDALSLARHYAALAATAPGRLRLQPWQWSRITTVETAAVDELIGRPVRKALGYWLGDDEVGSSVLALGTEPTSFGHPGAGGSLAWADRKRQVGIAVLRNLMTGPGTAPLAVRVGEVVRGTLPGVIDG